MAGHRVDHHHQFDLRNLSSMRQDGQGIRTASDRQRQTQLHEINEEPEYFDDQRHPRSWRFELNEENAINVDDDDADTRDTDSEVTTGKMGKDSGCTNCVSVFNILLGMAIVALWVYSYFENYTGKVIELNFSAGAWTGALVIISGTCTCLYSCIWNNCMGICALSFNIFVIVCTLACAGISGMDAFIEYRIYKDETYVPDSINVSYIKDALQKAVDNEKINEKTSEQDFAYDGAIVYALITLCCLLVTILTIAWSCYFCFAEEDDDDDDEESDDEDEYTNKRDNVSVRSPFTAPVPRGQMADGYNYGRRNYNAQQYQPQARQNWGYYDNDYDIQPSRNVTGYPPPLYEGQESPIGPTTRGWGNRDRQMNGGHESSLYHQRVSPHSQRPRTKQKGMTHSNPDYSRQAPGIPRASSRYYAESLPDHRAYGRNQYSQEQRAYSIDGQMSPPGQRRSDGHSSRRLDVNPDRSWMYNYY